MVVRRRHGTGATIRPTHVESGVDFSTPSLPLYGSQMDTEPTDVINTGVGSITDGAIVPGGLDAGVVLAPGTLELTPFASDIRPVVLVTVLPTLPHASYPVGAFVYKTNDVPPRLYKNVADAWVAAIGPNDIQADSITAGQIAAAAISTDELAANAVAADKIAAGAILTRHLSVGGASGNLLVNGSFEDAEGDGHTAFQTVGTNLTGWPSISANAKAYFPASVSARTGSYVAHVGVASGSPSFTEIIQFVPVVAGRRYRLHAWIARAAGSAGSAQIVSHSANAAKGTVTLNVLNTLAVTSSTLTEVSGEWTAPTDGSVTFLRVNLRLAGTPSADAIALFEDVELVAMAGTTEIIDDAITTSKLHIGSTPPARNLVRNGDFEVRYAPDGSAVVDNTPFTSAIYPVGWTFGGVGITVPANGSEVGRWRVRTLAGLYKWGGTGLQHLRPGDTAGSDALSDYLPVQGGRRVLFRVWYRGAAANNAGAQINVFTRSYDTSFAHIGVLHNSGVVTVGTGTTYIAYEGIATLPANAAYMTIGLRHVAATGGTTDTVLFDSAELYYVDEDVSHAAGDVVIDSTGITVTNGAITVQNAGATVIIDGSSNMFKIAATGTGNFAVAANTFSAATLVTLSGLGAQAAAPAHLMYFSGSNTVGVNKFGPGFGEGLDIISEGARRFNALTSGAAVTNPEASMLLWVTGRTDLDASNFVRVKYNYRNAHDTTTGTVYVRYYVLVEAAM